MLPADRVMNTIAKLGKIWHEKIARDILKPDGEWKDSVTRMICNLMMRGIPPLSLHERVMA